MPKDFINSILDLNSKAILIDTIKVDKLINGYKNQFDIDVKKYFESFTEIYIYQCLSTKLRFYFPFNLEGDSCFYEKLQELDWYYMPWKWEHETAKNIIKTHENILEVGSGGLGFVETMHNHGCQITGLELNSASIQKADLKGLRVLEESIEAHAQSNFQKYDIVCSFQVLEHITEVNSFIRAKIDCLRPGGKMIIAVPNNDSFIKFQKKFLLNSPPHHMGLWNKNSLKSIAQLFNLKIEKVYYEPLQSYHKESYENLIIQEYINKIWLVKKIFDKLKLRSLFKFIISKNLKFIRGHSILVVYTKL